MQIYQKESVTPNLRQKITDIVTKAVHHISQSLQANTRTLFGLVQDSFFPYHSNSLFLNHYVACGPGRVVGIATGYGLGGPEIESRWRRDFPHLPRPALGPAKLPAQSVPIFLQGGKNGQSVNLTSQPLLVPWSKNSRAKPLLLLWAVCPVQSLIACTSVHFTYFYVTRCYIMLAVKSVRKQ